MNEINRTAGKRVRTLYTKQTADCEYLQKSEWFFFFCDLRGFFGGSLNLKISKFSSKLKHSLNLLKLLSHLKYINIL